jgi:HEAT repeat protein
MAQLESLCEESMTEDPSRLVSRLKRAESARRLAHSHRRESHDVLIAGLQDSSKDVRFWCAFALGELAESRALPHLERLVSTDKRRVKGFHSVAKEAADAIENIRIGSAPHRRKNGCMFCVRR